MMSKFDPNAPASFQQAMLIQRLGGGDIRGQHLSRTQASDLIQILKSNPSKTSELSQSDRVPYDQIMREAVRAADMAGAIWLTTPVAEPSGTVCIEIVDTRTAFARWIKSRQNGRDRAVIVPHAYRRRSERSLLEACERAALGVFDRYGIGGLGLLAKPL